MPEFAETIPVTERQSAATVDAGQTPRAYSTDEQNIIKDRKLDAVNEVAFKVLFNHENRIRALEGKAAITAQQFKTALRNLL